MILLIGFVIGFTIYCVIANKNYGFVDTTIFVESFLSGLIGLMMGVLICGIMAIAPIPTEEVIVSDVPICAMKDTMGVEGSFFLGSGSVDSEFKYVYATKTNKGIKIQNPIDASNAYINYIEEGEQPHIAEVDTQFSNDILNFFFCGRMKPNEIYIYVPEGTIEEVYNIDLE